MVGGGPKRQQQQPRNGGREGWKGEGTTKNPEANSEGIHIKGRSRAQIGWWTRMKEMACLPAPQCVHALQTAYNFDTALDPRTEGIQQAGPTLPKMSVSEPRRSRVRREGGREWLAFAPFFSAPCTAAHASRVIYSKDKRQRRRPMGEIWERDGRDLLCFVGPACTVHY